jgi:hypothetical protein
MGSVGLAACQSSGPGVVAPVARDFPVDLLREIDQEGRRLGVTCQAFIKIRLADALGKASFRAPGNI